MMKKPAGLSIIVMLLCFDIAMYIIAQAGLYTTDFSSNVYNEKYYLSFYSITIITIVGAILAASAASIFTNLNPQKVAVISGFIAFMVPLFSNLRLILITFAEAFDSGGTASMIVNGFIFFQLIMLLIFVYQIADSGWASSI